MTGSKEEMNAVVPTKDRAGVIAGRKKDEQVTINVSVNKMKCAMACGSNPGEEEDSGSMTPIVPSYLECLPGSAYARRGLAAESQASIAARPCSILARPKPMRKRSVGVGPRSDA